MPSQHVLLELRTSRDSEHTPEAAKQLFASIPKLHNSIWKRLLGTHEHLSFEISVENQTIFFLVYTPARLLEYVKSILVASYPEIVITQIEHDPLDSLLNPDTFAEHQQHAFVVTNIGLRYAPHLPFKTYPQFKDLDALSPLLSTLAKAGPYDRVLLQISLAPDSERWKARYAPKSDEPGSIHPAQKALIDSKLNSSSLQATIKLAVSSDSQERADLMVDSILASLQNFTESEGNALVKKRPLLRTQDFLKKMKERSFARSPKLHLSLEELATLYHLPSSQVTSLPNIAWGKNLLGEPPENLPIVTRETPEEIKQNINVVARATYKNQEVAYGLQRNDRRRHMYVIGKTGTGKSTLLANMAINDLKKNEGLCVIDPHGDLVETLLDYIPASRINDVIYFDPSDTERTVRLNLFEGENVVHRELIASGIISVFRKLYGYSWGPRLEYILRNALLTLVQTEDARLSDILDLLTQENFRARIIEKLNDPILKNFWLYEYNTMQEKQRTEAISSILNKVGQFVSSPIIRDVVNTRKSSFSIEDAMDEGKILLANLSQGRLGEDNATLLGAMLITKIQLAAMSRVHRPEEERRDFFLYVDEFQNFATDSFIKILSEARKYRLNLILANQYIAQIPEEVQKAIFGNCGSMMSFVMGAEDAAVFSREFAGKYTNDDLVSLGRHQIINKITIDNVVSSPFPAMTLPLAASSNKNREKVLRVSGERYAKKKP